VTKKETNLSDTLSEAVSVATSVAYTRQEIQKLKTEFVSLLEKKTTEVIVEQVPGPVGLRGALGATGTHGSKGDKGDVGERGEKGEVGPQGNMGPDGLRGVKGDKGNNGEHGQVGPQGIQGIAGKIGPQGLKGDRGEEGKNGKDGAIGPTGATGAQGSKGDKGDKGDSGERGQDGQQGIQGSVGSRGEIGPQGSQGVAGKDGKDGDIKPVEEKFQKFIDNVQRDVNAFKTKVNAVVIKATGLHGGSGGSGEVNLRYLDDIDRDSITNGYVLSYDASTSKFKFVEQTGGAAGTDNLARSIANSSFSTANSALSIAQSAFAQANTGGGATESLNVQFDNTTGVAYKVVALNVSANTVLASSLDIAQVDKVLGVLDVSGETVTFGSITNVSWTWTPEQSLYLGSNGDIVTTSTVNGATFSIKIGYAISATKAFIKIGTPVVL